MTEWSSHSRVYFKSSCSPKISGYGSIPLGHEDPWASADITCLHPVIWHQTTPQMETWYYCIYLGSLGIQELWDALACGNETWQWTIHHENLYLVQGFVQPVTFKDTGGSESSIIQYWYIYIYTYPVISRQYPVNIPLYPILHPHIKYHDILYTMIFPLFGGISHDIPLV